MQAKQNDVDDADPLNYESKQKKGEANRNKPVSLKTQYLFLVETDEDLCRRQK